MSEDAKALLPSECTLEAIFVALDRCVKGYVADADLWMLLQDFGAAASFASLCALARETQLRRCYDQDSAPGRLSLRDLAILVLPANSEAFEAVCAAASDSEARSALYLLRHSEACPRCGVRVQRDGDAAGCPNVTCPICNATFHCFCVVGDRDKRWFHQGGEAEMTLTPNGKYQVHRLICTAARIAEDLDLDRRGLARHLPGESCDLAVLSEAFNVLARDRPAAAGFSQPDLRRAFAELGLHLAEDELQLLWRRYHAPRPEGAASSKLVPFCDFSRQLRPHAAGSLVHCR